MAILLPDLLYRDDAFYSGLALEYDEAAGRIVRIVHSLEIDVRDAIELRGRALMPGFINAHSHSFQRLIRGRTQWKPSGPASSDFWSWRSSMYNTALSIQPDALYDVSRFCFLEMLRAGYTTVGEFHYLQRDPAGAPYTDPNELANHVIAAAESVGIRICLINVCYATGGINAPLWAEQRRFATPELDPFINATEQLARNTIGRPLLSVGVAPHSVRAVPRPWIRELHKLAATRDLPFHMHVSEQPAEVQACVTEYGMRPVELLCDDEVIDARFTAVHGTHLADNEIGMLGDARANVCLCPTTERDLGDGLARISDLVHAQVILCLGTDSQTIIDPLEEMRSIEYHERLRLLRRVVVATSHGVNKRYETAPLLMSIGMSGGARALGLKAGSLEAGMEADFIAIDLDHPSLAGWDTDSLGALVTLTAPASVVSDVWVGGVQRVSDGHHADEDGITTMYCAAARQPS
jgi:formimidoylglutamate deiminase